VRLASRARAELGWWRLRDEGLWRPRADGESWRDFCDRRYALLSAAKDVLEWLAQELSHRPVVLRCGIPWRVRMTGPVEVHIGVAGPPAAAGISRAESSGMDEFVSTRLPLDCLLGRVRELLDEELRVDN
jgi:hypothetical protein